MATVLHSTTLDEGSIKSQIANSLDFAGRMVSVVITQI